MLFVKLKTFHNNNKPRRMPVSDVKWVNLTATLACCLLTVVVLLPSPANGFTPIGGFQNGEARKLFGGYRITPKHCRGTKTLPLSDPRSKGPTICMFNHECAQRNGEVVGACMDGFLFGACCQVPQKNADENTLMKDAQNPLYQMNSHSTEAYDSALYGSSQKFESNEFQEIQSSSTKYQAQSTTEASYVHDLVSQNILKPNKTASNNKIFYVNKGSVSVSSPSSISHNDDYVMISSTTNKSPFTAGMNNVISFTTELPMKISTDLVESQDSTQMPMILAETVEIKKNHSNGALDLDMGEFTHSDITHPGAESVLIDNDLQFSTGFGGPQSVYVPPPAHAEIIPPKRRPAQRPSINGPNKKPSNDQYVLIQTLEASKKPGQSVGTTSTGISTNIDSIESIILMLNGTNHGPSYEMTNTSPIYSQHKPTYTQNQGHGTTHRPIVSTYVPVTTARPTVTVTTGSGTILNDHISTTTTAEHTFYEEIDTKRPTTPQMQPNIEPVTSNKYHSVEMSDEKPSFVEIPSPPHKLVSDKVDPGPTAGPTNDFYNVMSAQVNYGNNVNSHKDAASNPDYGYTSPGQPTSDFNKMPAVGEAYPVMDEETSAYFESSMLSEEQESNQHNQQSGDKHIPAYAQTVEQSKITQNLQQAVNQENNSQNQVQTSYPSVPQKGTNVQSQGGYYGESEQSQDSNQQAQQNQKRPQSNYDSPRPSAQPINNQGNAVQSQPGYTSQSQISYQTHMSHPVPQKQTNDQSQGGYYDESEQDQDSNQQAQENQKRPQSDYDSPRPSAQPVNNQENIVQSQPGYISQAHRPISQENKVHAGQLVHNKPLSQVLTQNFEQNTAERPSSQNLNNRPSHQSYPTPSINDYEPEAQKKPNHPNPNQNYDQIVQHSPSTQKTPTDYEQISQAGFISNPTASHVHIRPTAQVVTTSFEVQSPTHRPSTIIRPTTQVVTHAYEVQDEDTYVPYSPRPTQQAQIGQHKLRPSSQFVTQGYDVEPQSDLVSQSSEDEKETYQTPESQVIAQLTDQIQNGYPQNARPTTQDVVQNQYNGGYLPRPTPQATKIQTGYFDNKGQSTARPAAQVINHNNQIIAGAGYISQPPSFDEIEHPNKPTLVPNRISTLIVQQQSTARPTKVRPPTPTRIQPVTYTEIASSSTQSTDRPTISSTSRPVGLASTSRPTRRPTKRITKRPSTQKKPTTNEVDNTQQQQEQQNQNQPTQNYNNPTPPPHKYSGAPPTQNIKPVTIKPPLKKKPPSTSYVTGPTTPRPEVEPIYSNDPTPSSIADKVDSFATSTQAPIYNSVYIASPTDEIILQNGQIASSNHQNYNNKPLFVKIPSATQKPPSPTVIITPKPTVVNLITSASSSKRPTTTPIPTFAPSNSYIYSPLITRRPEYASTTQEYVSIPQVTSNDFDDPGYAGPNTLTTQLQNKVPTDDRPAFPGYYGPTPSYPTFPLPGDKYSEITEEEEETYTSPNDFVNFPPVRNPNLNMSATSSSVTNDLELSTPAFVEDTILKDKMNTLVHKIVESLQGNFEALAEMIDDNNNTAAGFGEATPLPTTVVTRRPTTKPPTRRPTTRPNSSSRPTRVTTKKPPTRVSTAPPTKRPTVTTRRPVTTTRRTTTKRPVTRKPTRKTTTTTTTAQPIHEDELVEEEDANNEVDSNIGEGSNESGRKFQCGVRPHVKSGRIVGGKGSTFGEFPWQVLVRESTWLGLFTKNKCGGVLITNKYVITAAHCQPGFLASLVAVMGEFDISGDLEPKRAVTKNVKRVIVHRQYDPATFENDLALLEMESPVNYDSHIVPICMPADTADFTGRMATVTGWGRLKYGGGVPSVLQEVQVPIIENSVCQEMFHTAGHNKKILQSFLCAGYANGQKDSCEGDSGGPLVLQRPDGRYELAGTVSHGIKCAAPYLPGVYMRTTYYKPWLRSITGVK